MDKDELYDNLTAVVDPLLKFVAEVEPPHAVRACIVFTILSLVGPLDPTDSLGIIERSKFQLMETLARDKDKQPKDQFSFIS